MTVRRGFAPYARESKSRYDTITEIKVSFALGQRNHAVSGIILKGVDTAAHILQMKYRSSVYIMAADADGGVIIFVYTEQQEQEVPRMSTCHHRYPSICQNILQMYIAVVC